MTAVPTRASNSSPPLQTSLTAVTLEFVKSTQQPSELADTADLRVGYCDGHNLSDTKRVNNQICMEAKPGGILRVGGQGRSFQITVQACLSLLSISWTIEILKIRVSL